MILTKALPSSFSKPQKRESSSWKPLGSGAVARVGSTVSVIVAPCPACRRPAKLAHNRVRGASAGACARVAASRLRLERQRRGSRLPRREGSPRRALGQRRRGGDQRAGRGPVLVLAGVALGQSDPEQEAQH